MTNSELTELFGRLAVSVQQLGDPEDRKINGSIFRIYTSSEISLITERILGQWVPKGLFFEVFGTQLLLNEDGTLSISDEENSTLEVYSMTDRKMLQAVHVFLKWRLAALTVLNV